MVWSSRTIDTMIDGKATVILVFGYLLRNPHYDLLYIYYYLTNILVLGGMGA